MYSRCIVTVFVLTYQSHSLFLLKLLQGCLIFHPLLLIKPAHLLTAGFMTSQHLNSVIWDKIIYNSKQLLAHVINSSKPRSFLFFHLSSGTAFRGTPILNGRNGC